MPTRSRMDEWMEDILLAFDHRWVGAVPRPERVVVGVDGSGPSQDAVRWAAAVAKRLHLVFGAGRHTTPHGMPLTPTTAALWRETLHEDAVSAFRRGREAAPKGRTVEDHEVADAPAKALASVAQTVRSPLVAVGNAGHGVIDRLLLGSVSESLVHHAPVSTLVARGAPGDGPVIVGIADDAGSVEAAAWGVGFAAWLGRPLLLAHATPGDGPKGFPSETDGASARPIGWPPKKSLVALSKSEDASLLVVGHAGHPMWLGSNAIAAIRRAPCSVLIARPWETFCP